MEAIRAGPNASKKCYVVEIDWMRKFQAFGKQLLAMESSLKSVNVSYKLFLRHLPIFREFVAPQLRL